MKYIEEKFLLKLYRELYKEKSVIHSGDKGDNKFEMVRKYLDRLESSEKVYDRDKKGALEYLKNRYYDKYVIKEENIKDKESVSFIIEKQKRSLSDCLDYFLGDDRARSFPIWVRYWAFQGLMKMGTYNGDTNSYSYRNDKSTASFLILNELNVKSLNDTMQMMVDYLGNDSEVSDDELESLLKNGKFSSLFSYNRWKNIVHINEKNSKSFDGIWKSYPKGSDISELQNAVNKNVTYWCIEDPTVMEEYNSSNDFEVYYTKDEDGEYSIPKVAVVVNDGKVKEVRGVFDPHENIDGFLVPVVFDKLSTLDCDSSFYKRLDNVKKLNIIENKHLNDIELSKDELKFLYEIDGRVLTLGRDTGSEFRINNIKRARDKKSDFAFLFDCERDQVAVDFDELLNSDNNIVLYLGDFVFEREELPKFSCPKYILGNLECPYISNANGFENLEVVRGDVSCYYLVDANGFSGLREVYGNLVLSNLEDEITRDIYVAGDSYFKNDKKAGSVR